MPAFQNKIQEKNFQDWYVPLAKKWGIDTNPDNPLHYYDYRKAFLAGASPDSTGHWPSEFKMEKNPRFMINTPNGFLNTKTGKYIQPFDYYKWMLSLKKSVDLDTL